MPVGPLRLETLNQSAIDREAQIQGAPAFSKLRRALLQTSTIAATEDNPAKKREMLRAAMEGTGTGFSDVSLAAHRAALNKVSAETDIANRGLELTYQADIGREAQETGIASAERMQGLSLAESRAAQERGISASEALQEKSLAASKEAQRTGIVSAEKMQGLSLAEAREAQLRGITAQQAMQERGISAELGAQRIGITSAEKMQGLSLADAREAQLRGISAQELMQEKSIQSAEKMAMEARQGSTVTSSTAPMEWDYATQRWKPAVTTTRTRYGNQLDPYKTAHNRWQQSYQDALNNFYSSR